MNDLPNILRSVASIGERRAALHALAREGRQLASALIASPASIEELERATDSLRSIVSGLPKLSEAPPPFLPDQHSETFSDQSPVIGLANITAPPASLQLVDNAVEGTVVFDVCYEGPPGHVHGGWIAAMFDEVLGMAQALSSKPGMTARLEVNYRRPIPLHTPIFFRGTLDSVDGRKIYTSARSYNRETDDTYAEAHGLFISVEFDRFRSSTRPDGMGHANLAQQHPSDPPHHGAMGDL